MTYFASHFEEQLKLYKTQVCMCLHVYVCVRVCVGMHVLSIVACISLVFGGLFL